MALWQLRELGSASALLKVCTQGLRRSQLASALQDVAEVVAAVRDPVAYPSPLLAVGAMHSVTCCIVANQGTIMCMTGFNRIIGLAGAIDSDTQACQPSSLYWRGKHL